MDIATIGAAIGGLKNAIDLTKTAIAARDDQKLAEARQAVNDRIIDVQNAALALQEKQSASRDEIDRLKDELRDAKKTIEALETERSQSNNYKLTQLSQYGYAYKYVGADEPEHLICQPCFDGVHHRKVVLHFSPENDYTFAFWECPSCNVKVRKS
ncbi:hypothetical protein [Burkholderia multivorans]|uniref:hypothetical protein n=1 Tax=Burkholderia multivorans TaxID=87883 RepID=UPI000D01A54C|nr:hypothetical protein [Burkholderia multivorans]PRH46378.1 hypothetical protein C6V05_20835 [Burkholderia multivorans]